MPKLKHGGLTKRCACKPSAWTKCPHAWVLRFHHAGTPHFVQLSIYGTWPAGVPMPKTEALRLAEQAKGEIRQGTIATSAQGATLTMAALLDEYQRTFVETPNRRPHAKLAMTGHLHMLRRLSVPDARGRLVLFTALPAADVTPSTVEAIRHARRAELRKADEAFAEVQRLEAGGQAVAAELRQRSRLRSRGRHGETGINRLLARLRHLFSWAVARYDALTQHPFRKAGTTVVKLEKETNRSRRLRAGEEERLLRHANPHLKCLILAALMTGARIGELLSLTWAQVERDAEGRPVRLRFIAEKTKTARTRVVPVPTSLAAILTMRETAPDGRPHGPDAYVFGNEVGERVLRIQTAWENACQAAGATDLHFHDLRREFASRLLDAGTPLTVISAYLGHTNVTTTARYLAADSQLVATALPAVEKAFSVDRVCTLFVLDPENADPAPDESEPEVLDFEGVKMVPRARIELATLRFSGSRKRKH